MYFNDALSTLQKKLEELEKTVEENEKDKRIPQIEIDLNKLRLQVGSSGLPYPPVI